MADQHSDVIRYEEQYVRDVIFYLADDGTGSRKPLGQTTTPVPSVVKCDTTPHHKQDTVTTTQELPDQAASKHNVVIKEEVAKQHNLNIRQGGGVGCGEDVEVAAEVCTCKKDGSLNKGGSVHGKDCNLLRENANREKHDGSTDLSSQLSEREVMEIFEERERRFTEEILSPRCLSPVETITRPRFQSKTRSRSRSPCTPAYGGVGLEHLDNLVRLLEQLTELKDQNRCLRKKCNYLENTKSLLQVHNVMLNANAHKSSSPKVRGRSKSTKHSPRSKMLQHQQMSDGGLLGHYMSDSSDDEKGLEQATRSKPNKLTQRSQSVGSINVDMADIDLNLGTTGHTSYPTRHIHHHHHLSKRSSDKHTKDYNRFESMFSKSKISSKWERVKKVFSGKPEASTKTEHSTISAEQLVRANSKYVKPPSSLPQMVPGATDTTTMVDKQAGRASTSPTSPTFEPSSPVSIESDPIIPSVIADDQDIYEEIMVAGGVDSVVDVDSGGGSGSCSAGGHSPAVLTGDEMDFSMPTPSPKPPGFAPLPTAESEPQSSNFLTVKQTSLRRRQSSPTLCINDDSDAVSAEGGDSLELPRTPCIKRSSSFKVTKSSENFTDASDDSSGKSSCTTGKMTGDSTRKYHSHRSAWGRVKDIIHTRKDSLKRKNKRSNSAGDMLPDATGAGDGLYDYCSKSDVEDMTYDMDDTSPRSASPRLTRKGSSSGKSHPTPSPRMSPTPPARQIRAGSSPPRSKKSESLKSNSGSPPPPIVKDTGSAPCRGSTSPGPLDVTALMGCMSEEFNKKLQEWEEKKQFRRSLFKENSINLEDDTRESSDAARFTEEFIRKMEEWEKMKGLGSPPKTRPSQTQSPDVCTPPDQAAVPPSMEDLQKHLSESFSKTVQEWERIKTQRIKETGSPVPDTTNTTSKRSRKQERSKSRERDRSRSKYDKQRERERQKIEKKEQKIEKERQKLEKMRIKLEGIETMNEYGEGMSQEFARKLYEWEVMKGLRQEHPTTAAISLEDPNPVVDDKNNKKPSPDTISQTTHTRSQSAKAYKEFFSEKRERTQSESKVDDLGTGNATLSERRKSEVGTARSASVPSVRASSRQLVDDSTSIDLNLTNQDSQSAEERHKALLADVAAKEEELGAMQYEVQQLTERISAMDIDHNTTIENYKRELWASSQVGRYTIETDLVQASIHDLRQKVDHLTAYQGKLVNERNHLQYQLEVELRARQEVEARLVTQVRVSPAKSSQHQQAIESVKDFDKLCEFFLKLWSQLNELRLGILERNKLLADMQQHVLQQEVGNRLLAADMASRDLQLAYLQGARRWRVLRRSHTFAGRDHMTRGNGDTKVWSKQHQSTNYHTIFRRAIEQLRHGDIEATSVDWEWLERLRAQRASAIGQLQCAAAMVSHEAQTEWLSNQHSSIDNCVQTTMSMFHIPSRSPSSPSSPLVRATPIVLENKSIQADVQGTVPGSSSSIMPMATSTPVKTSPLGHAGSMGSLVRPQLVRQQRAESPFTPPNYESPGKKTNSAEAVFTFNIANTPNAGLIDVSTPDAVAYEVDVSRRLRSRPQSMSPEVEVLGNDNTSPWVRRCCTGDSDEPLSPSLYPPPSPIIRSRNTRKLKADVKSSQLYCDARAWKATPPKRVRHRRTSTEKRPDVLGGGENENGVSETDTVMSKSRGRSERFSIPQPRSLSVPPRDSVMYDLCFRDRHHTMASGSREQNRSCAVSDMINKFENGVTGSQINCCHGNRSPSPAIRKPLVTPMHRLKTAAELMEDTGHRRGWRSSSQTRASSVSPIPLGSSDKENERAVSKVLTIVQRLSREGTPDRTVKGAIGGRPMSPTGELIRQTVRRLSESSCDVKPALMDLTNGGQSSKMSEAFIDRRWSPEHGDLKASTFPSRSVPVSKKRHELPQEGQVTKFKNVYESKVENEEVIVEAKPQLSSSAAPMLAEISRNPLCDSIKSLDYPEKKLESENGSQSETPSVQGKNTLERLQKMSPQTSPTSSLSGSARDLKSKIFGRKSAKGSGGALTALCKQAMSVDVSSSENVDNVPGVSGLEQVKKGDASSEKPARTRRFLDTSWLQKPKRFFKVSKC